MKLNKTILFGATGLVGSHLLQILTGKKTYKEIITPVRSVRTENFSNQKQIELSRVFQPDSDSLWQNCDSVFICLGTTIKKAGSQTAFRAVDYDLPFQIGQMAKKYEIPRVHIVTAMGSNPDSLIFYNKVKGEIERDLTNLNLNQLYIYRPSLLLGDRNEFRIGEKLGEIAMNLIPFSLIPHGNDLKAIPAKFVASAMAFSDSSESKPNSNPVIYSSGELHILSGKFS